MTGDKPSIPEIQATIRYLYLMSFCPPSKVHEFRQAGLPLREGLAKRAGMSTKEYFASTLPEACRRIVSFHEQSRSPTPDYVNSLILLAASAQGSPENLRIFSSQMGRIAMLPKRSLPKNRLQDKKGCQFCLYPCRYGFFALVSRPDYDLQQKIFEGETANPEREQNPLKASWRFATAHLWSSLGTEQSYTQAMHLGNLAYCLTVLGMAKSRYPLPEKELIQFQNSNQALILTWGVPEVEIPETG